MSDIIIPRIRTLDVTAIERASSGYPEEMREPMLWLGGFIREECNNSVDVLEAKIKRLGFTTTASTFSKIFRGQWNRSANGTPLKSPVLALLNFIQIVDRLRMESRLAEQSAEVPFVETETWNTIRNYIDIRRAPGQVCKMGLIVGPTGSQKSHCLKHYKTLNNHGQVVHIEADHTGHMGEFISDLANAYGCARTVKMPIKKLRISEYINDRRTIIIDNVQRLHRPDRGWSQPVFNYLQKLQDDTNCAIILCACVEFASVMTNSMERGYFEQFEGRCGGRRKFLTLPTWTPASDLLKIAEAFKLVEPQRHLKVLEKLSRESGRIRILFDVLQDARRMADEDGRPLTIDYVKEAAGIEEGK